MKFWNILNGIGKLKTWNWLSGNESYENTKKQGTEEKKINQEEKRYTAVFNVGFISFNIIEIEYSLKILVRE